MIIGKCLFCKKKFRKREQKYKFCSLICSSNYNKNGLKSIIIPSKSMELAELIGILLGDGYISKYQISITLNSIADKKYVPSVIMLIDNLFPSVGIKQIKRKNENAIDIKFNSKIIADYFYSIGIVANNKKIPEWFLNNKNYRYSCLRGLIDTEGSISFKLYNGKRKNSIYKQLNFRNKNQEILTFARNVMIELGLRPTDSRGYSIYLSNNNDINIYRMLVGFRNPKLHIRSLVYTQDEYFKLP